MVLKEYKAYGKDKKNQKWKYINIVRGRNINSAKRTFKKMSGWNFIKLVKK